MNRTPVISTNLKSVGWEEINGIGTLEVEFRSGEVYRYHDVPKVHYAYFLECNVPSDDHSAGRYFHANIKTKFQCERVYKTSDPASFISPQQSLLNLAAALDTAYREGEEIDEPEGVRYIKVSDTLAKEISVKLRRIAESYPSGDSAVAAQDNHNI